MLAAEQPWSPEKLLLEANASELIYPPGEGWRYSNIGYLLVRQLIEELFGCSLQEAFQQTIFQPLGLTDLFVAQDRNDLDRLVWGNGSSLSSRLGLSWVVGRNTQHGRTPAPPYYDGRHY